MRGMLSDGIEMLITARIGRENHIWHVHKKGGLRHNVCKTCKFSKCLAVLS